MKLSKSCSTNSAEYWLPAHPSSRAILISVAQNSAEYWLPAHPSSRAILISVAQNSAGYWLPAQACLVAYSGTSIQSLAGNLQAGVSIRCGFFRH